jgi:hypothetical protein
MVSRQDSIWFQTWDSKEGRFFTGHNALRARLVDGRDADLVTLGRIVQIIVPAVRKFAHENQGLLLEAERAKVSIGTTDWRASASQFLTRT